MALTNMLTIPERDSCEPVSSTGLDYPYGLRISLNQSSMDKLGLKMLKVGDEVKIQAEGLVVSCNMDDPADEQNMNMQIQITELELIPESAQEESTETETFMS